MDVLLKSLTQHASAALLVFCVVLLILAAAEAYTLLRLRRIESKWRHLLTDSRGESLETLLYDHLRERLETESQIEALSSRTRTLEEQMNGAVRYVGLVRYDAFPDVAGSQSFSLAVYDERGDGAIISSIVGRNSCRVYSKPLVAGRSERDLSQEEQRAIRAGRESGVRPILSP